MTTTVDRSALDEAIANMSMRTSPYFTEYVFYMHLLAQCKVKFTDSLQAAAAVGFNNDHYVLYINSKPIIAEGLDKEGKPIQVQGFCSDMPIAERVGILKHEMLHIAMGHIIRVEDRNFQKFNIASDCAINQEITRNHLPDYAIYPDNFPTKEENINLRDTAEYYYDIIDDDQIQQKEQEEGESENEGGSQYGDNFGKGRLMDDHSTWKNRKGDSALQRELTKNMVERAANEAVKSAGTLPSQYSDMLDNLTIRREVDWKQVLRRIVGNKKANLRKTLLRRDRRLPNANWIKGKTKDRIFELAVVSDVSGSVSDSALYSLWGEIIHICDLFNTPVKMVQIDTEPSKPETLTKTSKIVERKACGGTTLAPALEELKKHNIKFNAVVVTTDGFLFDDDIDPFYKLNIPVIWLIEPSGQVMNEMNKGKMQAIKLKD